MKYPGPFTRKCISCIVLCMVLLPANAFSKKVNELQTLQIFFENDLFGDTDKYYTNAVQLTWLSEDLKQYKDDARLPDWLIPMIKPVIKAVPFSEDPNSLHNVGILFGQQIYTPEDIQTTTLISDDRPYAGYLYMGLALHSKTERVLDTLELVIGVVGPSAKAEFAQNTVHELRDIDTAKGWDNQLHDELALGISWQRKWRLHDKRLFSFLHYDLISHTGLTLGNVRIAGNLGGELRIGYNIPKDFGSDVIRAGAGVSTPAIGLSGAEKKEWGAHLFASSQAEVVVRDIFLDGNTWKSSHSTDKKNLIGEISIGLALVFDTFKLTYRHLFRTKQFYNQSQGQTIGSLTATFSF